MSILDDAIRQHLELKRAHGADDSELKRLEDEAFGPPQRPDQVDPFAEPPTEFLVTPSETPAAAPEIEDDSARSGRRPDIADLQEAPPASGDSAPAEELAPVPDAPPPSLEDAAEAPLPPPVDEAGSLPSEEVANAGAEESAARISAEGAPTGGPDASAPATPADVADDGPDASAPAATSEDLADSGPDTGERHAIAEQPTQMFDVQSHVDAEAVEGSGAPEENVAPPAAAEEDELFVQEPLATRGPDAEVAGQPPAEAAPTEEESAEYDFFNEQRLSDELDQALEAPLPPTDEHIAMPRYEDAPPAQDSIFDFESESRYEEDPSEEALRRHDAPEPASEEYGPPPEEAPRAAAEPDSEEADAYDPDTGHEDVLEDTPRFLEDADDDDLWFEQKPPKDFDL